MRGVLAGTLLAVVLVVGGCGHSRAPSNGEASKIAPEVLADAVKAADAATSYHRSDSTVGGVNGNAADLTIVKGKGLMGSRTFGGEKVDVVAIGRKGYMRAPAAFWRMFGTRNLVTGVDGKWVEFPLSNGLLGPLAQSNPGYFDELKSIAGKLTNRGATRYDGEPVVRIELGKDGGTLYVAATGTPYPLAIVASGGTTSFDSWNKPVTLTAPSGAIEISQLIH